MSCSGNATLSFYNLLIKKVLTSVEKNRIFAIYQRIFKLWWNSGNSLMIPNSVHPEALLILLCYCFMQIETTTTTQITCSSRIYGFSWNLSVLTEQRAALQVATFHSIKTLKNSACFDIKLIITQHYEMCTNDSKHNVT